MDEAETRRHVSTPQTFLTDDQGRFQELCTKVTICTSRIFVGVFSALQVSTAFDNPQWWAENIPAMYMQSKALEKWACDPSDKRRICKALCAIYKTQAEEHTWKGRENNAAALFGKKKKGDTANDSSSESKPKRKNKKTKNSKENS